MNRNSAQSSRELTLDSVGSGVKAVSNEIVEDSVVDVVELVLVLVLVLILVLVARDSVVDTVELVVVAGASRIEGMNEDTNEGTAPAGMPSPLLSLLLLPPDPLPPASLLLPLSLFRLKNPKPFP